MSQLLFLTNHALVLSFLARDPSITAIEMSSRIGITERATRKIISDFSKGGYIQKKKEGRRVRYKINPRMPLAQKNLEEKKVGDLLKMLA